MDALTLSAVATAGLIGWVLCCANAHVFGGWKCLGVIAIPVLAGYALFTCLGADPYLWVNAKMDKVTLGLAVMPILAWPLPARARRRAEREARQ